MLAQYYRLEQATGISIQISNDGSWVADICTVSVKKDQLTFEKKISGISSLNELSGKLPANIPISLNLTGRGILTKQLDHQEEINASNFSSVMPGARFEDYYVQYFQSDARTFASIIRRDDADRWLAHFKQIGASVLMLSLDAFPVTHIIPQLNVYDQDILIGGHQIHRNERGEWLSYRRVTSKSTTGTLKIGAETVAESLVLPYGAAFQLVMSGVLDAVIAEVPDLNETLTKTLEHKKFQVQGVVALVVFFVLLLANFLVFNHLNSDNNSLSAQQTALMQTTSNRDTLERQIEEKQNLLKQVGWRQGMRFSNMIDQIASVLPDEVAWTEVAVNPLDDIRSRNNKFPVFTDHLIRITGRSDQIIPVNEWMARIRTRSWVKNVQMVSYAYNYEQKTGIFSITVNY